MDNRQRKYTKEFLTPLVESSISIGQILSKLNLKISGGTYRLVQQRIREYQIPTNHFKGKGWAKGLTVDTSDIVQRNTRKISITDEDAFQEFSGATNGQLLRRLLRLGWENKCSICNLTEWLGEPITCHLDHINGINGDNRLENLRMLCPNCHQQTETWGNKSYSKQYLKDNGLDSYPNKNYKPYIRPKSTKKCQECENEICKNSTRCRKCADIFKSITQSKRPTKEELSLVCVELGSNLKIGKHFQVSDKTIKKWRTYYGI